MVASLHTPVQQSSIQDIQRIISAFHMFRLWRISESKFHCSFMTCCSSEHKEIYAGPPDGFLKELLALPVICFASRIDL